MHIPRSLLFSGMLILLAATCRSADSQEPSITQPVQAPAASTAEAEFETVVGVIESEVRYREGRINTLYFVRPNEGKRVVLLMRFAEIRDDKFQLAGMINKRATVTFRLERMPEADGGSKVVRRWVTKVEPVEAAPEAPQTPAPQPAT